MSAEPDIRGDRNRRSRLVIGRNAIWAVAQVIVTTILLFVVYHFVMRAVDIDQIGLLSIVSTTVAVARLSELGLSGAVPRFLPEHLARGEARDAAQVVVTATAAVGLVVGLVSIIAWPVLNALLPLIVDGSLVPEARSVVPVTLFSLWMNTVSGCVVMSLDGVNRADQRAKIAILGQGVFAVMTVLTIRHLGIVAIPVAQGLQAACVLLLAILSLLRELPETRLARPSFGCLKRIWLYGAHLQLITLLILFYDPATRLLLNHFGSLSIVGYFDLANRLISQVRSVIVSANQVMIPHYANLNITDPDVVTRTLRGNVQILLVISTVLFSMLSVSLFVISELWIGHVDAAFINMCMILIVGYLANSLSAGIYFMNLGVGAVLYNVVTWIVIIVINVMGGIFGGLLFGVTGVLAFVSAALVCGCIVTFTAYSRDNNVQVWTLASTTDLKFAVVGGVVYMIAILTAAAGFPTGSGLVASIAPIVLGGSVWACFLLREAAIAGVQLRWAHAAIASLRSIR